MHFYGDDIKVGVSFSSRWQNSIFCALAFVALKKLSRTKNFRGNVTTLRGWESQTRTNRMFRFERFFISTDAFLFFISYVLVRNTQPLHSFLLCTYSLDGNLQKQNVAGNFSPSPTHNSLDNRAQLT